MKSLSIILLLLFACSAVSAQKVKVSANPKEDLTKYKTYAWANGMAVANGHVQSLIVNGVDAELAKKGFRKVATDAEADFIIVAWTTTESDLYATNPSWAPALNSISTGIAAAPQTWSVTKGTLVIDISDAKSKNGVWRATASHTLEQGPTGDRTHDAKTVEKPINKAVKKMFKKFPTARTS
jgi:uncharacterized protein DUF4136